MNARNPSKARSTRAFANRDAGLVHEKSALRQPHADHSKWARRACEQEGVVWWHDLLWGVWNGLTAWVILVVHVFGGWGKYPFFDGARAENWYDFGFLIGTGSPFLGIFGGRGRVRRR